MSDVALQMLLPALRVSHAQAVWFADEHVTSISIPASAAGWQAITNRYDVFLSLQQRQWLAHFNDFDTATCSAHEYDAIVMRVAKEKAVTHYLINEAGRLLKPGGTLYLAGHKQEGIKTYGKKAAAYLHGETHEKKDSGYSLFTLTKGTKIGVRLDDQQYQELRTVHDLNGKPVVSKPGIFGWDRIDQGSTLLAAHAERWAKTNDRPTSVLDLGCGWGYLLLQVCPHLSCTSIVATDNNAAAMCATQHNLTAHRFPDAQVLADDCGKNIRGRFDLILCNPPFHQGFTTESSLTESFLQAAQRLLQRSGTALFVVNCFVPLEKKAAAYFADITLLEDNGSFRVFSLSKPR